MSAAYDVGVYAGNLEAENPGGAPNDSSHHLGDDTGRLLVAAYDPNNLGPAVGVIKDYLAGLNSIRKSNQRRALGKDDATKHILWAISDEKFKQADANNIRQAVLSDQTIQP